MTKKEKQEHIEFIQSIVDKDIKFDKRKIEELKYKYKKYGKVLFTE